MRDSESAAEDFGRLETEWRNPNTADIDRLSTLEMAQTLHHENATVQQVVEAALPAISTAIDIIADRLERGGRLFYFGAGTSGRLGVLDASECPPTFGVGTNLVQGVIAGGDTALRNSIEGAEDSREVGAEDVRTRAISELDVVVGIAASGRTPYAIGALDAARAQNAATISIANVSNSEIARHADIAIEAVTGPEVVTGSTRMKAGTAQKLILNLISTGVMIRIGKVYGNLMVDVTATNAKLRDRAARIVMAATGSSRHEADTALIRADGEVKTAIVMLIRKADAAQSRVLLADVGGRVRAALELN